MQELFDEGVADLGGVGSLLLEIEYTTAQEEFKEAVYRLPTTCNDQDIVQANMIHADGKSVLVIQFNQHDPFTIYLQDRCKELVEVRLPEAVGGDNITPLFHE